MVFCGYYYYMKKHGITGHISSIPFDNDDETMLGDDVVADD